MDLRTLGDFNGPTDSLVRPTDRARRALRRAGVVLAALAVVIAVPVGASATLTEPAGAARPDLAGVSAGVATLLICWVLLGLGAAWWHRRLAALDQQRWAADWARVEPTWSGRR